MRQANKDFRAEKFGPNLVGKEYALFIIYIKLSAIVIMVFSLFFHGKDIINEKSIYIFGMLLYIFCELIRLSNGIWYKKVITQNSLSYLDKFSKIIFFVPVTIYAYYYLLSL